MVTEFFYWHDDDIPKNWIMEEKSRQWQEEVPKITDLSTPMCTLQKCRSAHWARQSVQKNSSSVEHCTLSRDFISHKHTFLISVDSIQGHQTLSVKSNFEFWKPSNRFKNMYLGLFQPAEVRNFTETNKLLMPMGNQYKLTNFVKVQNCKYSRSKKCWPDY